MLTTLKVPVKNPVLAKDRAEVLQLYQSLGRFDSQKKVFCVFCSGLHLLNHHVLVNHVQQFLFSFLKHGRERNFWPVGKLTSLVSG